MDKKYIEEEPDRIKFVSEMYKIQGVKNISDEIYRYLYNSYDPKGKGSQKIPKATKNRKRRKKNKMEKVRKMEKQREQRMARLKTYELDLFNYCRSF